MTNWTQPAADKARAAQREAETLARIAQDPAFAALPVTMAFFSGGVAHLVCELQSRDEIAATFEALAAQRPPLPIVAFRGTLAGMKPACDYQARDGEIVLDAEFALPCYYTIDGFTAGMGAADETLKATFENETDRIAVWLRVKGGPAKAIKQAVEMHRGRVLRWAWDWTGLPNANTTFGYAGSNDSPGGYAFAFDTSTDLAAWLNGSQTGRSAAR